MNNFSQLGLSPTVQSRIKDADWNAPTAIQKKAIPVILEGADLIAQAQTGTGKTAAFALPLIDQLNFGENCSSPEVLVLTPTRELAAQVAQQFERFVDRRFTSQICLIYGGQPIHAQFEQLKKTPRIVIGTPGRLIDHIQRGSIQLNQVKFAVIDEADEMLNLGFKDEVEYILSKAGNREQTLLFSATMPKEITEIAELHLKKDYSRIEIKGEGRTSDFVDEGYVLIRSSQRFDLLCHFLELELGNITLVFTRTRKETTQLADRLQIAGYQAEALSGELSQNLREAVVKRLKENRLSIVVATDVAARGLDIDGISLVVNYDVPLDLDSYVHRVGRTGRAGRKGRALLFVTPREIKALERLESFLNRKLPPVEVPPSMEIMACRKQRLIDNLKKMNTMIRSEQDQLFTETLEKYETLIAQLESHFDSSKDLALTALMLASQNYPLSKEALPPSVKALDLKELKAKHNPPIVANEGCSIIVLNSGRLNGIRPKDIVGAISHEAKIDGTKVGAIRIEYTRTLFEMPNDCIDILFERLSNKPICGRLAQLDYWDGKAEAYIPNVHELKRGRYHQKPRQREYRSKV